MKKLLVSFILSMLLLLGCNNSIGFEEKKENIDVTTGSRTTISRVYDFNGDGIPDTVVIEKYKMRVSILNQYGALKYELLVPTGSYGGSYGHFFEDVNGDGRVDLIQRGDKLMWIGIADVYGKFNIWTHTVNTGRYGSIYDHFFEDVNGDGRKDLIQIGDRLMWIGIADINGKFNIWTHTVNTGRYGGVYHHDFTDMNNDGRTDLIQTRPSAGLTWIGLADKYGKFEIWSK